MLGRPGSNGVNRRPSLLALTVGRLTESFSWLDTAAAAGAALGAAGGSLTASFGPGVAFTLAGAAGLAAVLGATLRRKTLPGAPARV